MRDCKIFCSLISSCILLVSVLNGANADNPYRFYTWKITYGDIYPLGVKQRGILINGQFLGPHIDCVTDDNLIISVYNYLNEPFLISWHHFLQCPQGLLGKHFEKLIQCDPRLNFLSKQGEITLDSPYFEPRISVFDDPSENKAAFDLNNHESPTFFNLRDAASPSGGQSSSSRNEQDTVSRPRESIRHETPSPSSVMDTHVIEEIKNGGGEQT